MIYKHTKLESFILLAKRYRNFMEGVVKKLLTLLTH